jgi:hypothetical protein
MIGLNYVSCSTFRVPIARLAAAQAALRHPANAPTAKVIKDGKPFLLLQPPIYDFKFDAFRFELKKLTFNEELAIETLAGLGEDSYNITEFKNSAYVFDRGKWIRVHSTRAELSFWGWQPVGRGCECA